MSIVHSLLKYPDVLEELYNWIILPDYEKFNSILKWLPALSRLQKPQPLMDIYRGIDPTSSYQNTMGLKRSGVLWFGKLNHSLGDTLKIDITEPLSFTNRRDIAAEYGTTIIECPVSSVRGRLFVFTKELYYAISQQMNIEPLDVHEVILLPKKNAPVEFKIIAI